MEKFLGIEDIRTSLNGLEKCEILNRQELIPTRRGTPGWYGLKDPQNKTDKFLSLFGVMYVIVNSWKDKGKVRKEHILKDIVPCGFDARIEKIPEQHQQPIEEKDAVIAVMNNDLQDHDNQIQAIKYDNVALQGQRDVYKDQLQKCQDIITHLRIRYVDHAKDPGKDNIMIIEKSTAPEEDEFLSPPKTHRTTGERSGPSFIPLYQFHPLTNIQTFICNFACEMTITYF